ncbi:MAG: signal peptide peptidase SppA [Candidatus Firestonebacteria bacterium]|nr:signal peptide peptidase SppA [Candidatus Firestonebacteria bacterium]
MEKNKILIYTLLGFCALSTLLGTFLIFKKSTSVADNNIEFPSLVNKSGISVVYIYGEISVERETSVFPGLLTGADQVVDRLRKIGKNKNIKAIVLRINSPGGTAGASQEIYEEVNKLRKNGKKVVVSMGDMAASGAYYISCAADKIVANPATVTGSIGVIFNFGNMEELFKKIGVKIEVVKSGKNKDIGAFWRSPDEEETKLLQGLIDNTYEQFVKAVAEGRNMPIEKVKELADGSIFNGEQALEKGLVDKLGNLPDAIQLAQDLAGLKGEPNIIKSYSPVEKFMDIIGQKYDESSILRILGRTRTRLAYILE